MMRQEKPFEDVVSAIGLTSSAIEAKEQECLKMLEENAKSAKTYGINSSYAFLWENKFIQFSWDHFEPVLLRAREQKPSKEKDEKSKTRED